MANKAALAHGKTYTRGEMGGYMIGMFGQNLIYQIVNTGLYFYFQNVICLPAMALGWIFMLARVWDAVNDPIMGTFVDRTHTRWGKCRPYLIFGPPVIMVVTIAAFLNSNYADATTTSGRIAIIAWAGISYILWGMTYTAGDIPLWGITSLMTEDNKYRDSLLSLLNRGEQLSEQNITYCISLVNDGSEEKIESLASDCVCVTSKGKPIKPKTMGQKRYCTAIENNTITIAVGPAGTGKTYLAVAMAVTAFRSKEVNRIILTRPAVEAGEKLGFLPGDLQSKVDPYLRPLYDALFDMLGAETYQKYLERGNIEVAPLAYMRGRTLDDSFIILDEAQNTTSEQMKMFLTRLGNNSKMVITGDITQIDLPSGAKSGLKEAVKILKGIKGIERMTFSDKDVVRHRLVQDIIRAYEKASQRNNTNNK